MDERKNCVNQIMIRLIRPPLYIYIYVYEFSRNTSILFLNFFQRLEVSLVPLIASGLEPSMIGEPADPIAPEETVRE